jgi:predicted MFS family arabinose efflux permease
MKQLQFLSYFQGFPPQIWWLTFVNIINRSGAMVVAFLPLYLDKYLHLGVVEVGYISMCYGVGSVLGMYLGGWATDKLGFYRVQLFSLLACVGAYFGAVYVHSFWAVACTMFGVSVLNECFRPANFVAVQALSTPEMQTRSFSLHRVGVNLAISVALILGGWVVQFGWHWIFWADSITCFLAAIIFIVFIKNKKKVKKEEKQLTTLPKENTKQQNTPLSTSPYKDPIFVTFCILTMLSALVFMQFVWTVPLFFSKEYGWSTQLIGNMSAINGIFVMLTEMPIVGIIEGKRPKMWIIRLGIIFYALPYLMFVFPKEYAWLLAILYMFLISLGEIFVMPFGSSWSASYAGEGRKGQFAALYGISYSASNVLAPMLGTQIIGRWGFTTLWWVLIAICGVVWVGFWGLEKILIAKKQQT